MDEKTLTETIETAASDAIAAWKAWSTSPLRLKPLKNKTIEECVETAVLKKIWHNAAATWAEAALRKSRDLI